MPTPQRKTTKQARRSYRQVRTLVPTDDLPCAAIVQRFVTFYFADRDLKSAACRAGMTPEMGERLYREPKVRAEIDRQINLAETERAKLKAKADLLTVPLIDTVVIRQLKRSKDRVPSDMVKIAYGRAGLLDDKGNFPMRQDPNVSKNAPFIYQRQSTVKKTTTEEVSQMESFFAVKEY